MDVLDQVLPSLHDEQGDDDTKLLMLLTLLKRGWERVETDYLVEKERLELEAKHFREAEIAAERAAKEYAAAKLKAEREAEAEARRAEAEAKAKAKAEADAAAKAAAQAKREADVKAAVEAAAKAKAEKDAAKAQAAEEKAMAETMKAEAKAVAKAEAEAAKAVEEANAEIARQMKQCEAEARAMQKAVREPRSREERDAEARQAAEAVAIAKEERAAVRARAAEEKAAADVERANAAATAKAAREEAGLAAAEATEAAKMESGADAGALQDAKAEAMVKQRAAKEAERRAAAAEVAERKLAAEQAKAEAARQKAEASAIAKEELANAREAAAAADSQRPPSPSSSPRSPAANMAQQRLERAQSRFPGLRRGSHHHTGPKGEHEEEPETRQVFLSGTRTAARRASHAEASSSSNSGALAIESIPDMVSVPNTKASAAQVQPWRDGASRSAEMGAEVNLSGDCLALNDDGDTLVCIGADGSGSTVSTYSAKRGEILQNFTGHTDLVTCVATQGDLIASSGRDKRIRLWSKKKSNKCVGLLDGCEHTVYGLAMSGSMLASGEGSSKDVGIVRLWDLNASSLVATFSEHMGTVWSVALGSDVVVSASFDMSAKVWTSTTGSSEASTSLATLAHPNWVFSVSVEANLAATGCGDRIVRLWSLSSYSCLRSFTHGAGLASTHGATAVSNLIFSVRLSGSFLASGSECGRLCVWSLAGDGECCATLSHGAAIKGLAISKKGSFVASAGGNLKKLVVWRPGGGK